MVFGLQNIDSDDKNNMRNKTTLLILALTACIIWTYIAVKLFSPGTENVDVIPTLVVASEPEKFEFLSLALSPFINPDATTADPAHKQNVIKRTSLSKNKTVRGRLIGNIEAGSICMSVVEIEKEYHYISEGYQSKDCRLVKKFGDDSVRIVYSGDTLMLYKNDERR